MCISQCHKCGVTLIPVQISHRALPLCSEQTADILTTYFICSLMVQTPYLGTVSGKDCIL